MWSLYLLLLVVALVIKVDEGIILWARLFLGAQFVQVLGILLVRFQFCAVFLDAGKLAHFLRFTT